MVVVYTDGSCVGNGKKNSKGGVGVYFEDSGLCISQNIYECAKELIPNIEIKNPTNNKAELLAILKALVVHNDAGDLIVKSDSMYCINSLTKWYKNWVKSDWKTSAGKPVLNKEIIEVILSVIKKYKSDVKFVYVKAHQTTQNKDSYGNNKADELATKST